MSDKSSPGDLSISKLMVEWGRGDFAAISEIYSRYGGRAREIVRMRLGTRLRVRADSEDVLQSAFLQLLKHPPPDDIDSEPRLIGYLVAAMEHGIDDLLRRHTREKRDMRRESSETEAMLRQIAVQPTPSQITMEKELYQRYLEAVESLSQPYREAIVLSRHMGMSSEECALVMKLPTPNTFRRRLSEALAKVAIALSNDERQAL